LNIFGEENSQIDPSFQNNLNNIPNNSQNNSVTREIGTLEESNLDEEEKINFQKLERRQSKVGQQLFEIVSKNREKLIEDMAAEGGIQQEEELDFASVIRNESERFEKEKLRIRKKLEQGAFGISELQTLLQEMEGTHQELSNKLQFSYKNQEVTPKKIKISPLNKE
jgi:hypothetical protein